MRILVFGGVSVIIVLVCASVCLAGGASFRGLGDLPGGDYYSEAYGVSAYGNAVVGNSNSANSYPNSEAFIWTEANGMVGLGDLPGGEFYSWVFRGVSCDGSFVAGFGTIFDPFWGWMYVPCRWSGPNDIQRLGQGFGWALAMSADGLTVVGMDINSMAFRWTEANGMQELGCLPGAYACEPLGISADGRVIVGGSYKNNGMEAFRWTQAAGMMKLSNLPEGNSCALDVSEDGLVVAGWTDHQAFVWTEDGGMKGLGQLPDGGRSFAYAVSGDGTVVVGEANNCAFIWDANHGMQRLKYVLENAYGLDLTGWQLLCAYDISADGRTIVGGDGQAWMAVLGDPPPSVKLTVQVDPNDIDINAVTPSFGEHIYYKNWPVVLKAETFKKCPDVYRFSHWSGDVSDPNSATTTLMMTEDKTITAVYYADLRRCGDECHPILQGDLNRDCYINFEDFALYCAQWLSCTHPDCD